ncbi:thioredoxin-disulfide reductase [Ponticaulis sp.]|uniref:thioredoxin-disulfide reductase n=1 Tax=Ponticaulis sp. TaxID=2020902 RepID=UPI000C54E8B6|nr:thioredoxin-disulfide reductase [Ponticaulis sp.]MAJ08709.1 thioredoxin-disulfide reductase [Ponticaulis sp.]RPG17412.1 MAG: thioredoxin-disulfide reductase [Hyphomonadaceae bacterium TMED125]HBH90805.1 thioredoxin-disulfide reductase [Hyphomonadaceae bacterium]
MSDVQHESVIIIGAGPAGYTAAVYAARAMRNPLVLAGYQPGGQLTITTEVENWPGEKEIQGPDLMVKMREHAEAMGARVEEEQVAKVDLQFRPFQMETDSGKKFTADVVIISTGAQAKWLGLPTEEKFKGFGVSACATCDGFFYREKEVIVIGGGNTAVEEALYLTNFASKVTLVHRRDSLRCEKILENRFMKHPKTEVIWDSVLDEVVGTDMPLGVTGAKLKNVKTGEVTDIDAHGVFVAIGHAPSTELFQGQVTMRDSGYIDVKPGTTATNIPGVFAAGDVTDEHYRQAVTAAGMGCMAALEAERYLAELEDQ